MSLLLGTVCSLDFSFKIFQNILSCTNDAIYKYDFSLNLYIFKICKDLLMMYIKITELLYKKLLSFFFVFSKNLNEFYFKIFSAL